MTSAGPAIPAWPHKPAPNEPRRIIPERQMLWRGLALAALTLGLLRGAASASRWRWWLALPAAAAFTGATFLCT
ncbi:MAG: hypothetical protein ACR2HN_07795 [Tepidiformaceae bacterium]